MKKADPLAAKCLEIVSPELKREEEAAIKQAIQLLNSDEGLSGDKAQQLWQKVAAARALALSLKKTMRRGRLQEAKQAKELDSA